MKHASVVGLISFFICASLHAQSVWTWQNPLPQGNDLYDVFVIDRDTAVAVGRCGVFMKTTNRGMTWSSVPVVALSPGQGQSPRRITQQLNSVWFNDSRNGVIVGDQDALLKTTDSGNTWTLLQMPFTFDPLNPFHLPDTYYLKSVYFANDQAGWAVGYKQTLEDFIPKFVGAVVKTTDGGASWTDCSPATQHNLNSVCFVDTKTGYAVGGLYNVALILKTTDGGSTWSPHINPPTYQNQSIAPAAIHLTSAQKGWIVGGQDLTLKTADSGTTWEKVDWSALKYYLTPTDVFFPSPTTGWIIGSTIVKTTDGGDTWGEQKAEGIGKTVHFSDNGNGWMAGTAGLLVHTSNSGADWNRQTRSVTVSRLNDLQFMNSALGWAAGLNGAILKTTNGGAGWTTQSFPSVMDVHAVHFIDANAGWVAGAGYFNGAWTGKVYKTDTGGIAWTELYSFPAKTPMDIFFTDSQNGWLIGETGMVKRTTNGGTIWTEQTNPLSGTTQRLESVYFADKNLGWIAAGFSGKILATTDGGSNWAEQTGGTSEWLSSVHFINDTTGWIAGGKAILKTTNGGALWTTQTLPDDVAGLQSIHFFDALNGFAAGGSMGTAVIIRTTDGGASWKAEVTACAKQIFSVFMASPSLGWVAGEDGAILRYGPAGTDRPPVFVSSASITVTEKTAFLYTARAIDPEGSPVAYVFSDHPAWMTAGDSTLTGSAPAGEGSASFTVTASDGANGAVLNVTVTIQKSTNVARSDGTVPDCYSLSENYPDPFNPCTSIRFGLPVQADVELFVLDIRGKRIREVFHGVKEAGRYETTWDGKDAAGNALPSGVYFFEMRAETFRSVHKMVLIR